MFPTEVFLPVRGDYHGWLLNQHAGLGRALEEAIPVKAPYRDHLLMLSAPFTRPATEIGEAGAALCTGGGGFGGRSGIRGRKRIGLVHDYNRDRRWVRTFMVNVKQPDKRLR